MKEYVALFLLVFFVVAILPLVAVELAPPIKGNIVMEAKYGEKKVFILESKWSFLDVSRVDSELKRDLRLPDLFIIGTRDTMIELWGRWNLSAYSNVDRVELYYVRPGRMVEKKLNLSVVIYPTHEADIYNVSKDRELLESIPDILKKARDFKIDARTLRDLLDKRDELLKGIFREHILRRERVAFWKLLESTWTEKDVARGKLYTINGSFSLSVSKDPPEISWVGEEVRARKGKVLKINLAELEINLAELNRTREYPYFLLSAFFMEESIDLSGNEPRLGYITNTTKRRDLEGILDCYYKYFLGGWNPLVGNYTNMIPGLFAQKWVLGRAIDLNPITLDERRDYVVNSILGGELKPKELADRMFWSVVASWIVNSLFISALLTIAVIVFRRAW